MVPDTFPLTFFLDRDQMFDQHNDGSHEITLHNVSCPGCTVFPNTSGVLKWDRAAGITYSLTFTGIQSLVDSQYYKIPERKNPGVGRFSREDFTHPTWIAETDDGTQVRLYGVNETQTPSQTYGTSGFTTSCSFNGMSMFAVVEIPMSRMLAFDNSTQENYRIFFTGAVGHRFHKQENVSFIDLDGTTHGTIRRSITLSDSLRVALVGTNSYIKCKPSGWLAFENAPTNSDCEIAAFPEQNFISFLNGEKVPFHWADRRVSTEMIRRTYFGWEKSREKHREEDNHQPLPFMNGVEVIEYGEEVLSCIPDLFQSFVEKSKLFNFCVALHPLWTALDSVLEDRLALASVSLERIANYWRNCRAEVLKAPSANNASVWKNKSLMKSLREVLHNQLEECLNRFIKSDSCDGITDEEKVELRKVVTARIGNLTDMPNSAQLRRPFEDLQIPLSAEENKAIQQRNSALHGRQGESTLGLEGLDEIAEYFDRIRMLITKFVLKFCDYTGPYVDYASRPSNGNFEIKKLQ